MDLGLVLGLLKVAIEAFNEERQGHFQKELNKINKDWQDEMALPDNERSDFALDNILLDSYALAKLVVGESSKK